MFHGIPATPGVGGECSLNWEEVKGPRLPLLQGLLGKDHTATFIPYP